MLLQPKKHLFDQSKVTTGVRWSGMGVGCLTLEMIPQTTDSKVFLSNSVEFRSKLKKDAISLESITVLWEEEEFLSGHAKI